MPQCLILFFICCARVMRIVGVEFDKLRDVAISRQDIFFFATVELLRWSYRCVLVF